MLLSITLLLAFLLHLLLFLDFFLGLRLVLANYVGLKSALHLLTQVVEAAYAGSTTAVFRSGRVGAGLGGSTGVGVRVTLTVGIVGLSRDLNVLIRLILMNIGL